MFAVPGPIDSRLSRGCHALIKDGAKLVESIDDVLAELGPLAENIQRDDGTLLTKPAELMLNEIEQQVLATIDDVATSMDDVVKASGLPIHRVLSTISVLEMRRLVRRVSGTQVARASETQICARQYSEVAHANTSLRFGGVNLSQSPAVFMIEVRDLRKSFGATVAVDGITFDVRAGETFGLLGPNGAGKSTTIAMLTGALRADGGIDSTGRRRLAQRSGRRRRIGVAPQALSLYEELTAAENLTFFGRLYRLARATLDERVDWALEFAGLADRRKASRQNILRRHEAAAESGRRAGARSASHFSRRADGRRRSAVAKSHLRTDRRASRRRPHGGVHDALHGRGPAAVRPRGDHGPRQDSGPRHDSGAARTYGGRSVVKGELVRPPGEWREAAGRARRLALRFESDRPLEEVARLVVGRRGVSNARSCPAGSGDRVFLAHRPELARLMRTVLTMAAKDLRLMSRDWLGHVLHHRLPDPMGIFFGSIMGSMGGDKTRR